MNKLVWVSGLIFLCQHCIAAPLTIDLFTNTTLQPVAVYGPHSLPKGTVVHVYYLDKMNVLENQMQQQVAQVYRFGGKRLAVIKGKKWLIKHKATYQTMTQALDKALRFHITKIPAIVFNGHTVVLGTTDVPYAYRRLRAYQNKRHNHA